jgi:hypothetical protein
MSQRTLFDTIGGMGAYQQHRDPPRAATADPATSHEAAERNRHAADTNIHKCAAWVKRHPGCTSKELASFCTDRDLDRAEFGRRLPEAEDAGLIRRGEPRACAVGKGKATTWWPPAGA